MCDRCMRGWAGKGAGGPLVAPEGTARPSVKQEAHALGKIKTHSCSSARTAVLIIPVACAERMTTMPADPPAAPGGAPANPQRLMITKMVLENFKSYAGVREIGPFHKCFSSVVGPNGSGKSNVIDAMLFVFGKKASKLRLNNVRRLSVPRIVPA